MDKRGYWHVKKSVSISFRYGAFHGKCKLKAAHKAVRTAKIMLSGCFGILPPGTIRTPAESVNSQGGFIHFRKLLINRFAFQAVLKIFFLNGRTVSFSSAKHTNIDVLFCIRIPVIQIKRLTFFSVLTVRHDLFSLPAALIGNCIISFYFAFTSSKTAVTSSDGFFVRRLTATITMHATRNAGSNS